MYVYTSPVAADIEKSWPREVTVVRQLSVVPHLSPFLNRAFGADSFEKMRNITDKDSVLEIQQMRLSVK